MDLMFKPTNHVKNIIAACDKLMGLINIFKSKEWW